MKSNVIAGNYYNKHSSKNPIARYLTGNFYKSLLQLARESNCVNVHEVGCGEGYLSFLLSQNGFNVRGTDLSSEIIQTARDFSTKMNFNLEFNVSDIQDLNSEKDSSDLIVCCEVLEHLKDPNLAIKTLKKITKKAIILSVPREPLWRILNIARFQYLTTLGNTPGHIQHWSQRSFLSLVDEHFEIKKMLSPVPWTMVLAVPK